MGRLHDAHLGLQFSKHGKICHLQRGPHMVAWCSDTSCMANILFEGYDNLLHQPVKKKKIEGRINGGNVQEEE